MTNVLLETGTAYPSQALVFTLMFSWGPIPYISFLILHQSISKKIKPNLSVPIF